MSNQQAQEDKARQQPRPQEQAVSENDLETVVGGAGSTTSTTPTDSSQSLKPRFDDILVSS